jgi:ribulose-5-phosphate 4-epimerase/fuculose-1-phosphate aldolase
LVRLLEDGSIEYYGESKPSVDTPIQISLYKDFPHVNYMIHGHTYVEGAEFTDNYFPCGDMREYYETRVLINQPFGVLNLVNHGFFMYADTLENLEEMVDKMVFMERNVGNETIKK